MKQKIRVLSIGHSYVVSANRSIMRAVADDPRFEVILASPSFIHGSLRSMEIEPENVLEIHGLNVYFSHSIHLMYYSNLSSLITRGRFDLVHIWEEPYVLGGYQIARACVRAQVPYFFRSAQSLNKKYPFPFSFFERYVLKNAAGWNAGASLVHKNLISRGYPENKSVIINLGTDQNIFFPDEDDRRKIRNELGVKGFVIGFSGRLVEAKGLDVLMKALDALKAKGIEDWSLLALGSGPYKKNLLDWAKEKNIEDRVHVMLAQHSKMPSFMRAMDCLVAPSQTTSSWKEQFGRMITEAFASEVPVIGSTSGEIPFVIDNAGLVVDEKDFLGWANAIEILITQPDICESFKTKGLKRFQDQYEVGELARKYKNFYLKILEQTSVDID